MSILSQIKEVILEELSDGKEHTADELKRKVVANGIKMNKEGSGFRTAIYQLKNSGVGIVSREKGIYQICKKREYNDFLTDFTVLLPERKTSKCFVYVHANGKIVLNGYLNSLITSRNIEIRLSQDYKKMALIVDGINYHKFTKSGHTTNGEFVAQMKKRKAVFPVAYEMEKQDDANIWLGRKEEAINKSKKSNNID